MEEGDEGGQEVEDGPTLSEATTSAEGERSTATAARPAAAGRLVAVGAAALVVAMVRNRLWATPNLGFFVAMAERPGRNPFPAGFEGDYLLTNVTGPVVAWTIGATRPHHYVLIHLAAYLLGCGAVIVAASRRFGPRVAGLLAVIVAASPASTTTLEWLGQPDAFTAPLAMGLVVARRRATVVALAVLIGITHAEQGLIIAIVAGAARLAVDRDDAPSWRGLATEAGSMLGGVVSGALAIRLWFWIADVALRSTRWSFLDIGLDGFWRHHRSSGIWLPIGLWGMLWVPIAMVGVWLWRRRDDEDDDTADLTRRWCVVLTAAVAALAPVAVTLDQTRVYAMTTAPLLVAAAVLGAAVLDRSERTRIGVLSVVSVVALLAVPGFFTAGLRYDAWDLPPSDFARFLRTGEHPGELTSWLMEPFPFDVPPSND